MKRLFSKILFTTIICLNFSLSAQKLSTTTSVQEIQLGDPVKLFINLDQVASDAKVFWPKFQDQWNQLEIIEKSNIDTIKKDGFIQYKQQLTITGFDSGLFTIPSFPIFIQNPSGVVDTLYTDSLQLMVNTIDVDTTQPFKFIKDVMVVELTWKDRLPLIVGITFLIIALIFIIRWIQNRRKKNTKVPVNTYQETLQEKYLRMFNALDEQELWQNNQVKEYYTQLSTLVREYIEERFQTPAMEFTTEELLQKAKKHREMAQFRKSLKPLLEAADLAKFAKANLSPEEHIEAMHLAKDFITISKPKPQPVTSITPTPKK
jgi:hypothetical protein